MGPAIAAYRRALAVTARSPAFTIGVPGVYLLGFLASVVVGFFPFVGWFAGGILVAPATAAVALGMADGALTGDDPVGTGIERLEDHYVSMMGAYAALAVANTLVWLSVFALVLLGLLVFDGGTAGVASSAVFVAVALAVLGALVWGALVLQFVGVAIVVGDETATSTFRAATRLFRTDRRGVVAYSALRVLTGAAAFAVVSGLFAAGFWGPRWLGATWSGADAWLLGFGLALLGALVVWPLAAAFLTAYHVAYYRARTADRGTDAGSDAPTGTHRHAEAHGSTAATNAEHAAPAETTHAPGRAADSPDRDETDARRPSDPGDR